MRGPTAPAPITLDEWLARFNAIHLDAESVRRTSFPWADHRGRVPTITGHPGRSGRGLERVA